MHVCVPDFCIFAVLADTCDFGSAELHCLSAAQTQPCLQVATATCLDTPEAGYIANMIRARLRGELCMQPLKQQRAASTAGTGIPVPMLQRVSPNFMLARQSP